MRAAGFAGGIGPRGKKRISPPHVITGSLPSNFLRLAGDRPFKKKKNAATATVWGLSAEHSHIARRVV